MIKAVVIENGGGTFRDSLRCPLDILNGKRFVGRRMVFSSCAGKDGPGEPECGKRLFPAFRIMDLPFSLAVMVGGMVFLRFEPDGAIGKDIPGTGIAETDIGDKEAVERGGVPRSARQERTVDFPAPLAPVSRNAPACSGRSKSRHSIPRNFSICNFFMP